MATFYVSTAGNDTWGGQGPDASNASTTLRPWRTVAKALGAAGIASGDTVHIGPGAFRETVTVAMTSATAETFVLGDPKNEQGFKDGSGVLLAAEPVVLTAYTTNDSTAPAAAVTLDLAGRDFLTFQSLLVQGGTTHVVSAATATSTNITFRRCVFVQGQSTSTSAYTIRFVNAAGVAASWVIEQCLFGPPAAGGIGLYLTLATHSADYDVSFVVRNCHLIGGAYGLYSDTSGALSGKPGGIVMLNNLLQACATTAVNLVGANHSSGSPAQVHNNIFSQVATALSAGASGQMTEDYNLIQAVTARSNVTAGANSLATFARAPAFDWGYSSLAGFLPRLPWTPRSASPLLGFGNSGSPAAPTTDLLNRPRPAGGGSTANGIGPLERHDTAARETTTVDAGGVGLKITGPGDHDLLIPVNAASTTISVKARYDTNHGTTNKPQALLLANGEIGVAAQTLTMSAAVDTWETLTFSAITPTAKGVVTVRLVSRAAAGSGLAYFDTLAVT